MSEKRPASVYGWEKTPVSKTRRQGGRAEADATTKRRGNVPDPPRRGWVNNTPFGQTIAAFQRLALGRKGNAPADHTRPGGGSPPVSPRTLKEAPRPVTVHGEEGRNHREGNGPFITMEPRKSVPETISRGVVTELRFESPTPVEGWTKSRTDDFKKQLKDKLEKDVSGCKVNSIRIEGTSVFVEVIG